MNLTDDVEIDTIIDDNDGVSIDAS
jgi:hypothetical protein